MPRHTPPFADALRSLTLAPSPETTRPPAGTIRGWVFPAASIACAVFAAALVAARIGPHEATPAPAAAAPVSTIIAAPLRREITGSGYVIAPHQTAVFPAHEGRITAVLVDAGDVVTAGQALITLSDANAGFALEKAQAARAGAGLALAARELELAQAEATLARILALAARQAVATQQAEEAQTARDLAANAVLQARQSIGDADLAIRIAQDRLAELTIRAPIPGTITRIDAHPGDSVLARADSLREDQSLATITDTTSLVIDADVAEASLSLLRPGLRGEAVLDSYPNHPFPIDILRIAPVIVPEKGTVTLRLALTRPPAGIRPAMAARIRITTDPEPQTEGTRP